MVSMSQMENKVKPRIAEFRNHRRENSKLRKYWQTENKGRKNSLKLLRDLKTAVDVWEARNKESSTHYLEDSSHKREKYMYATAALKERIRKYLESKKKAEEREKAAVKWKEQQKNERDYEAEARKIVKAHKKMETVLNRKDVQSAIAFFSDSNASEPEKKRIRNLKERLRLRKRIIVGIEGKRSSMRDSSRTRSSFKRKIESEEKFLEKLPDQHKAVLRKLKASYAQKQKSERPLTTREYDLFATGEIERVSKMHQSGVYNYSVVVQFHIGKDHYWAITKDHTTVPNKSEVQGFGGKMDAAAFLRKFPYILKYNDLVKTGKKNRKKLANKLGAAQLGRQK